MFVMVVVGMGWVPYSNHKRDVLNLVDSRRGVVDGYINVCVRMRPSLVENF